MSETSGEDLAARLAAIAKGLEEIRAELKDLDIKCERPFCDNRAIAAHAVGRYLPLLCEEDILILEGPRNTWQIQLKQIITMDCERRFMQSQVPVWIAPEERVARDTDDSSKEGEIRTDN